MYLPSNCSKLAQFPSWFVSGVGGSVTIPLGWVQVAKDALAALIKASLVDISSTSEKMNYKIIIQQYFIAYFIVVFR